MPKTVTRVAHCIINWLERMGVSATKIEGWRTFVDGEIYSFSEKFKLSAGHFSSMLLTVVITMLQLAFFYLVPYFLMLAFGHHEVDFFSVMAASAFVQLLSSAVARWHRRCRGWLRAVPGSFLWVGVDRRLSAVASHYVYRADDFGRAPAGS